MGFYIKEDKVIARLERMGAGGDDSRVSKVLISIWLYFLYITSGS